jgi:hypothetical protein
LDQRVLGNVFGVSRTSMQSDSKARVIVEDSERVTTAARELKLAFEIHLPELIGSGALEALKSPVLR